MATKQLTPEELVENAFFLFAPDDADWEQYKRRRSDLLTLIRSYGEAQREQERAGLATGLRNAAILAQRDGASAERVKTFEDAAFIAGAATRLKE